MYFIEAERIHHMAMGLKAEFRPSVTAVNIFLNSYKQHGIVQEQEALVLPRTVRKRAFQMLPGRGMVEFVQVEPEVTSSFYCFKCFDEMMPFRNSICEVCFAESHDKQRNELFWDPGWQQYSETPDMSDLLPQTRHPGPQP